MLNLVVSFGCVHSLKRQFDRDWLTLRIFPGLTTENRFIDRCRPTPYLACEAALFTDRTLIVMMPASPDVTQLLIQWREGKPEAFEQLLPLVYDELRQMAHRQLWKERSGHTLHTTDLVHEAYLRLVDQDQHAWQDRSHFYAVAAHAMRHILIDYARKRQRVKRGGNPQKLTLDQAVIVTENQVEDLIALDQALSHLESVDERLCRMVECRYFGGLTIAETADVLGVSSATVKRDWNMAKAWLLRALSNPE